MRERYTNLYLSTMYQTNGKGYSDPNRREVQLIRSRDLSRLNLIVTDGFKVILSIPDMGVFEAKKAFRGAVKIYL